MASSDEFQECITILRTEISYSVGKLKHCPVDNASLWGEKEEAMVKLTGLLSKVLALQQELPQSSKTLPYTKGAKMEEVDKEIMARFVERIKARN